MKTITELIKRLRQWAESDGGTIFTEAADALEAKPEFELQLNIDRLREIIGTLNEQAEAREDEIERLKLSLFYPLDEDAKFDGRARINFRRINANFGSLNMGMQMVDVGQIPGDGKGDTIRAAWIKVNENFAAIESFINDARRAHDEAPGVKYSFNQDQSS